MEKRIDYLLQRYINRQETDAEFNELMKLIASGKYRTQIEARFGRDLEHRLREGSFDEKHSFQPELDDIRARILLPEETKYPAREPRRNWLRVAAVISFVVTASFIGWKFTRVVEPNKSANIFLTITSDSSNTNKIILGDGTIVWLKGKSLLTYPKKFEGKTRKILLTGEALFEVAKDAAHPFVIDCGNVTTTVLGTSFSIKSGDKNTEVLVLTGRVAVTSKGNTKAVFVHPNEKIIYTPSDHAFNKMTAPALEVMASIDHTEYNMSFSDASLREVAKRIEGKFDKKVLIVGPRLANCFITADFTDQSLEATLNMISKTLGFTYEIRPNEIIVTGPGC